MTGVAVSTAPKKTRTWSQPFPVIRTAPASAVRRRGTRGGAPQGSARPRTPSPSDSLARADAEPRQREEDDGEEDEDDVLHRPRLLAKAETTSPHVASPRKATTSSVPWIIRLR